MKNVLFVALVFITSIVHVHGQDNQEFFSLDEALEYAAENAYQKISSQYDVTAARKRIWESIASGLPQVDLSATYNHSMDLTQSLLPIEFFPEENWPEGAGPGDKIPVAFGTPYDANYNVGVTQLLFDGSYFVGVQAANVFLDYTRQQQRKTEIEVKNSVAQAYFLGLSARENLQAFSGLLSANEELLRESRARYENGFIEEMDVAQMELLVNDSRKRLMDVTRNEEVALSVLKFTMGMNPEKELELTDSLGFLTHKIISQGVPVEMLDPETHIDYQLALTNEESQRLYLRNEQANYLPRVSAFYNYQKIGYSEDWNVFGEDWFKAQFVGLQVTVPIFTSGMRNSRVNQQKLKYLQSQNDREMALHSIKNEYVTAQANMKSSYEQYLYSVDNKDIAKSILDKTREKYREGMASSWEYTQQQTQYIQAHLGYVESAVNLMQSHIELLKATGQL